MASVGALQMLLRQHWREAAALSQAGLAAAARGALLHLSSAAQQPGLRAGVGWSHLPSPLHRRAFSWASVEQVEALRRELAGPPRSLQHDMRQPPIPKDVSSSVFGRVMLKLLMFDDKKNQLIIGGQALYDSICEQVDDGALQRAFGMDPKVFYSSYTLLAVHVWLVIHRLSNMNDRDARFFKQRFYNHFQADVERRIYQAGVQIGVNKWLKKLETVFYSSGLSFDRAVRQEEGAERMEAVVLREFFGGDGSKALQAELIAKYLLHELACLKLTDEAAIMQGRLQFSQAPFRSYRSTAGDAASGRAAVQAAGAPTSSTSPEAG